MVEGVVGGQEVVVAYARACPEMAKGADDVAGPQFHVAGDPGGRIDGVGQWNAELAAQLSKSRPGRHRGADRDHGRVEIAFVEKSLQLLGAADHGNSGHLTGPSV